jgi:hypothetical protein
VWLTRRELFGAAIATVAAQVAVTTPPAHKSGMPAWLTVPHGNYYPQPQGYTALELWAIEQHHRNYVDKELR